MTGFIEDFVLRQEGLDDKDLADINAALPEIQHLDQIVEKEWPNVNRLFKIVIAEWPKFEKLFPILLRVIGKIIAKQRSMT